MKTVAVTIQKGGVGKTTVAAHLAWHLAGQGFRTVVVDLDAQANCTYTLEADRVDVVASQLFDAKPIPKIQAGESHLAVIGGDPALNDLERAPMDIIEVFLSQLAELEDAFDVCIIDTNPSLGVRTVGALFAADYVVSPVEVETYSIQGTAMLIHTIESVKERKKQAGMDLTFLGMLPNKVNNTSPMHRENLKQLVQAYPHLVIPFKVSQRTSIGEALADQVPVWKLTKSAAREAAREMRAALNAIQERIGLAMEEAK